MECYIFEEFFWSKEEFRPWLPSRGDDFVSWQSPTVWPQEMVLGPEAESGCWAPRLATQEQYSPPLSEHEMPGVRNSEPPTLPGCVKNEVRDSKQKSAPSGGVCNFCRQNGDRREFYSDHVLKDSEGNVVCPVLRCHTCELCGATGSRAHTRSYCPLVRNGSNYKKRNATSLKKTLHDSSGRVRPPHVR